MSHSRLLLPLLLLLPQLLCAQDISTGVLDDFEDGTTQGWRIGLQIPNSPTNIAGGGDEGADDNYLEYGATGVAGPGGKQIILNSEPRWTGDWVSAGVNTITVNMSNIGGTPLSMRIAFQKQSFPGGCWSTTTAQPVPADGSWHSFVFVIDESTMTQVSGSATLQEILAQVTEVRVLSNANGPSCAGEQAASTVGFDDFRSIGDSDGDGISDLDDNCTAVANPAVCVDNTGAKPVPAGINTQIDCVNAGFDWQQADTDGDLYGNHCDTDIAPQPGGDCSTNFLDLNVMKSSFFAAAGTPGYNPDADLNFDGSVNFIDLNQMKAGFFGPPGPGQGDCGS
ncbi:MAG: hypothetical protein HKN49_06245 [Gammaproteobacteria bacterium]|nr:hypothetical protein [Gammaproteobacteria bacterium]